MNCPLCGNPCPPHANWCYACGAIFGDPAAGTKKDPHEVGGWACIGCGGLIALYFFLFFSIAAPGSNYVNLGLMNDRSNGLMFGLLIAGIGATLLVVHGVRQQKPSSVTHVNNVIVAPPPPPPGFNVPLQAAMFWTPPPQSLASTSMPLWRSGVRAFQQAIGSPQRFSDREFKWGHEWGVPPDRFAEFVNYIYALQHYHNSARSLT